MWRVARVLRGRRRSRFGGSIAQLPSPQLRRRWNALGDYTPKEKRELIEGEWRTARPVQLVSDPHDRDRGGGFTTPLTFASDEDAAAFLQQESEDNAAEHTVPTLQAAHDFFIDLARSADEEVDVQNLLSSSNEPGVQGKEEDDESRKEEARDVHRHFFMDYYVQQNVIDDTEGERFALANAMLTPCTALFQVNTEHPLQRLVVRDQLERHQRTTSHKSSGAGWVFRSSSFSPVVFEASRMPPQGFDEPARLPYSAATSILAKRAALELPRADTTTPLLTTTTESNHSGEVEKETCDASAAYLHAMLQDDDDGVSSALVVTSNMNEMPDTTTKEVATQEKASTSLCTTNSMAAAPPTLLHVQWLQRQLASDGLVLLDALSPLLSLLAYRAACPATSSSCAKEEDTHAVQPEQPRLILDLYGAQANDVARQVCSHSSLGTSADTQRPARASLHCSYYRDIAHRIWAATQDVQPAKACSINVALAVVLPGHARRPVSAENDADDVAHDLHLNNNNSNDAATNVQAALSVDDLTADTLFIQRRRKRSRKERKQKAKALLTNCNSEQEGSVAEEVLDGLLGACDVVLCTPPTTEDGLRPRGVLGQFNTHSTTAATEVNAIDAFVHVCAAASDNFTRLCRQLTRAIKYAKQEGGWVIYATHSLNPIENEAIVCAVLTDIQHEQQQLMKEEDRYEVQCVPLDADMLQERLSEEERACVQYYLTNGRRGVTTWTAIEGGAVAQDASRCDAHVLESVTAAAWRSQSVQSGSDGLFMILVRVTRTKKDILSEDTTEATTPVPLNEAYTLCTQPFLRDEQAEHSLPHSIKVNESCVSLVSSAVHHWASHLTRQSSSCWDVVQAGVPLGIISTKEVNVTQVPWSALQLSSAVSNTSAASAALHVMQRHGHALPLVTVSVHLLSELLRRKTLRSDDLQRRLRRTSATDKAREVRELSDFMAAMEQLCRQCTQREDVVEDEMKRVNDTSEATSDITETSTVVRSYSVVLQPHMTYDAHSTASQLDEKEIVLQLHPAVSAELASTCVFAKLDILHHTSSSSHDTLNNFVLSLHIPASMPHWQAHAIALEQVRLGLRDALLYIERQVYGSNMTSDDAEKNELYASTDSIVAEEAVQLREDEYSTLDDDAHAHVSSQRESRSTGDVTEWLSPRERAHTTRKLRGLRWQLQQHNFGDAAQSERPDWVREVNYHRRAVPFAKRASREGGRRL